MSDASNCSLTDCDVPSERRSALKAYRAKRRTWLDWIDKDEDHAIWTTLSAMIWNDVSFRTLAHLAANDPHSPLANSILAEKLINGHVATQVLAIRRLMDKTRNTISLRRLISDIRSNYALFTRENYVCHDGLPYDYEAVMHAEIMQHASTGPFWGATSGPQAWGTSQMAHQQFDRLSGISSASRKREDRLPRALLDRIEGWLNTSAQTNWLSGATCTLPMPGARKTERLSPRQLLRMTVSQRSHVCLRGSQRRSLPIFSTRVAAPMR